MMTLVIMLSPIDIFYVIVQDARLFDYLFWKRRMRASYPL